MESHTSEHSLCLSLLSKIIFFSFFLVKENWVSPPLSYPSKKGTYDLTVTCALEKSMIS